MALLSGSTKPPRSFGIILCHAATFGVPIAKGQLCIGVTSQGIPR
jgi:hypothetical protein